MRLRVLEAVAVTFLLPRCTKHGAECNVALKFVSVLPRDVRVTTSDVMLCSAPTEVSSIVDF
jgi:hypothetical protein